MSLIRRPSFLLPTEKVDLYKWCTIACDQFTSQPQYWQELENLIGDAPSTLHLIYPEVYLGKNRNTLTRTECIRENMLRYLSEGILTLHSGYVLVQRTTSSGKQRLGLMCEVDLEQYDFSPDSTSPIRATEQTVTERLPVRVEIRKDAALELPHIMLLMDDDGSFMRELFLLRSKLLYDTSLNMGGGAVRGYALDSDEKLDSFLASLSSKETLIKKYGRPEAIAFAVGDGNHSLATAKVCWENIKKTLPENLIDSHPARYALCELVSLQDASLDFEPIHRVVFDKDGEFVKYAADKLSGKGSLAAYSMGKRYVLSTPSGASEAIEAVQRVIDDYCTDTGASVDYIHGVDDAIEVAEKCNGTAIIMPLIRKAELFKSVCAHGALPRKSFSMGEGRDKRYYLESRPITL